MSNETETQMEVEENEETKTEEVAKDECVVIDDDESNPKSSPTTPSCDKKRRSTLNKSNLDSSEKMDKNLKLQIKLENAKKRQEEKERKEKEKKEREEARIKREEEWKRKREEEERAKQKRQEEREKEKERKAAELAEKEKQKQEANKKREEEKKMRDEEKRLKDEERKQKEEEKRKKEEEKLREEEEKRQKEAKVKNQFISFFIKKETPTNEKNEEIKNLRFMPFQLKENMTVAPSCRRDDFINMSQDQRDEFYKDLHEMLLNPRDSIDCPNYLQEIRNNPKQIRNREIRCRRRVQMKLVDESSNDDIKFILPATDQTKFKVKYLHFDPKVYKRPPYYGTWRKKSKFIGPRRPFGKDEKIFDYEFDSDDEWEGEPEGESICESEKDEDEEIVDDDEDDGFFVPHGHLSDDELDEEEKELDPEIKKARETTKREQWEIERKKGSKVLIPKCFIVPNYWKPNNNYENDSKIVEEIKFFERLKCVVLASQLPINLSEPVKSEESQKTVKGQKNLNQTTEASPSGTKSAKSQKSKIQLNPQSPMVTSNTTTAQAASPGNTTPSIIKFISKMSKKDVICKLEPVNGVPAQNTGVIHLSPLPTKVAASFATPGTPNSPKMTPTSSAAEKRVCSGNGENAVKRLKLDENQSVSNEQNHPSTPNTILTMFKNSGSCKKSLKMNRLEGETDRDLSKSPSKKMDVDESDKVKKDNKENSVSVITID